MRFKPQKVELSLGTTNANVERACFSTYITQITPLDKGNHELCMGHYTNVERVCFPIYITQITPMENGNNEVSTGHPLLLRQTGNMYNTLIQL